MREVDFGGVDMVIHSAVSFGVDMFIVDMAIYLAVSFGVDMFGGKAMREVDFGDEE